MQSTEVKLASLLTVPEVVTAGDFANMYSLNERIVAAESCWFVAKVSKYQSFLELYSYQILWSIFDGKILMDIKPKILKLSGQQNREHCDEVITQFQTVAGQLRSLVYRAACPFLIRQSAVNFCSISPQAALNSFRLQILPQIVENSGWDTKKLKETNHEWVDKLVASSREVLAPNSFCFCSISTYVMCNLDLGLFTASGSIRRVVYNGPRAGTSRTPAARDTSP